MMSALARMPQDHPQREEVQRVLNNVLEFQQKKISEKEPKRAQQAGMTCIVFGLQSDTGLNGTQVYLQEWVPEKERWKCKVLGTNTYIGVKPKNLQ